MSDVQVRPYAVDDRGALRAMMNALQAAERAMEPDRAHWSEDDGASYIELAFAAVEAKKGAIFIAEPKTAANRPHGPLGFATCWHEYEDDPVIAADERDYLYVSDLFVYETSRGRGVAGLLLEAAERHGRILGLRQMRIGVLSVNAPARRAYQKHGFDDYEMMLRKRL